MKVKYGKIAFFALGSVLFISACTSSGGSRSSAIGQHAVTVAQESGPQGRYKPGPRFENHLSEMISKEAKALGIDATKVGGKEGVPMEINREVLVNINYFANDRRSFIVNSLSRGSKFIPMMKGIFRKKGLPEDLVYLAIIESGFQTHAVSSASAVGPWQFIASTGRRYNLTIDEWLDERNDPVKSTYAAADYLTTLHDMFNSWPLAIAAYNSGEGKIKRGMSNYGVNDFWDMSTVSGHLANETKLYVPSFLAVVFIAKDPEAYGISYEKQPLYKWDEVLVNGSIDLKTAADLCGSNLETLKELNPHLKKGVTPPNARNFVLRVPEGSQRKFAKAYAKLPKDKLAAMAASAAKSSAGRNVHVVRKGESVQQIARKYGVNSAELKRLNKLKGDKPRTGARLQIPAAASNYSHSSPASATRAYDGEVINYIIQSGDTKSGVAAQFGMSWAEISELNGFGSSYRLVAGKIIKVKKKAAKKVKSVQSGASSGGWLEPGAKAAPDTAAQSPKSGKTHTVAKGETLGGIAAKYKMSVKELAGLNKISGANIRIGQKLKVYGPGKAVEHNTGNRAKQLEEKVAPTKLKTLNERPKTHKVAQGETLGGIAEKYKMSINDLTRINGISGTKIRVGQILKLEGQAAPSRPAEGKSTGGSQKAKPERAAPAKTSKVSGGVTYTVQAGETLYAIANKHKISTDELLTLNPKISGSNIRSGQKIQVPAGGLQGQQTGASQEKTRVKSANTGGNAQAAKPASVYKVIDGDTLYSIAHKHKLSVEQLKKINGLSADTVRAGQSLKIK